MFSRFALFAVLSAFCYSTNDAALQDKCMRFFGLAQCNVKDDNVLCKGWSACIESEYGVAINGCNHTQLCAYNLTREDFETPSYQTCLLKEFGIMNQTDECDVERHKEFVCSNTDFNSTEIQNNVTDAIDGCYQSNEDCLDIDHCCMEKVMPICFPYANEAQINDCYDTACDPDSATV